MLNRRSLLDLTSRISQRVTDLLTCKYDVKLCTETRDIKDVKPSI